MSVDYEAVIGLECHVQLGTQSKAFGTAATTFGRPPNTQTDAYTLALPGTLPVLNHRVVEFALRMGIACGCKIRLQSRFARKHYFYPDLPKGYQISQYDEPLCEGGSIDFVFEGKKHHVKLTRIHLEEDAGKNIHLPGTHLSLVDLNRAGVPLIEIVSEPDLRSAEEAGEYLRAIRKLVRFLRISDGNMEEGSLRCDANVSVRPRGQKAYGTRTELKNINSFKYVQKAIEHEIARQIDILRSGGTIVSETRGWDPEQGTSHSQRKKEQANDYRYFPDPDLPPLCIEESWITKTRSEMPEAPMQRYDRYTQTLGLSEYDASVLTAEPELGEFFDQTIHANGAASDPKVFGKMAANWISSELLGSLNKEGKSISQSTITPAMLAELIALLSTGTINGKTAKDMFAKIYSEGGSPKKLVASLGLSQISDPKLIEAICQQIVQNPTHFKQIEKFRAGNNNLLGFFVGLVMKETQGRANPEMVNEILKRVLLS